MLQAGDEIARTQRGNNNAYAQDNDISWVDWNLDGPRAELLEFTRYLVRLNQQHPGLRRRTFFQGRQILGSEGKDVTWFRPDGLEMGAADWQAKGTGAFGLRLAGDAIDEVDRRGNPVFDDTLLILLNPDWKPVSFVLPIKASGTRWEMLLDTRDPRPPSQRRTFGGGTKYRLEARSLALFSTPSHA